MKPVKMGTLFRGLADTPRPEREVNAVVTDSRRVRPGSVFIAIGGERMDGHDFVNDAFLRGADAAVVERMLPGVPGEQILVPDTRDAYILMAKNYRALFPIDAAAVTGSVGKTTTKEMVAAIFSAFGKTLKNEGNRNNEIGLPETIFALDETVTRAVFEMGMDHAGDIRKLTGAVRPRAAIITAIGISHIENLGSRENILKAKLEVAEGMDENGVLVLNGDDAMLLSARDSAPFATATFAIANTEADVVAKEIMFRPRSSEFLIADSINGTFRATIPALGRHNIMDAVAAYTLATRIGLDPARSAAALADFTPVDMRQNIVEFGGITVIEDCYNANPDSMQAALGALAALPVDGIRAAVLGDMLELGSYSEAAHRRVGIEAAAFGVDILLCYGDRMRFAVETAKAAGVSDARHFADKAALAEYLSKTLHPGDAVVFKGSRRMQMEDIIEIFYQS